MARFTAEDADRYGGQGGGGFFSIQNDRDVKKVRLMYNKVEDVEGMSVHKVQVGDKERYVNCLRAYNEPVDNCPFCREKKAVQARLFIPVYNVDEDAVQIWDRGKTMFGKITGLCSRYASKGNLVNNIFEVERQGKAKDPKTTYEFYQMDKDDTEIEDLGELPKILGGLVLDKSADDMEYYLEQGEFPPTDDEEDEAPVRRRPSSTSSRDAGRRTPASRRNNEDTF